MGDAVGEPKSQMLVACCMGISSLLLSLGVLRGRNKRKEVLDGLHLCRKKKDGDGLLKRQGVVS